MRELEHRLENKQTFIPVDEVQVQQKLNRYDGKFWIQLKLDKTFDFSFEKHVPKAGREIANGLNDSLWCTESVNKSSILFFFFENESLGD